MLLQRPRSTVGLGHDLEQAIKNASAILTGVTSVE